MSDFLAAEGIPALAGYSAEHITADLDLVVVGNAISRGNPELEEVLDRKIRYCSLPEAIREEFLWGARSIVMAGTHGKTTTTGADRLAADARRRSIRASSSAASPGTSANGRATGWAGARLRDRRRRVRQRVLRQDGQVPQVPARIAVVNNVEFDHADIYADIDAVTLAFRRLVNLVPRRGLLLLGADSPAALRARGAARVARPDLRDIRRRRLAGARPRAGRTRPRGSRSRGGSPFGTFEVPLIGRTTSGTRWPLSPSRPRSASTPSGSRRAFARSRASSGVSSRRQRRRRHGLRRLRPPSDRGRRDAGRTPRVNRAPGSGRFRTALGLVVPAVFQDDFARAFGGANEVCSRRCSDRRSPKTSACRCRGSSRISAMRAGPPAKRNRSTTSSTRRPRAPAWRPGRHHVERRIRRHPSATASGPPTGRRAMTTGSESSPAGDSALIVEFDEPIDPAVNARAIAMAPRWRSARDQACGTSSRRFVR